jgi:2',3'-cyclic-nucleotide 2'-phosphodiesterase (5'-nucleotidase family)
MRARRQIPDAATGPRGGRPPFIWPNPSRHGASPLVSAAFHDEPTIEIENSLGLDLSSVGNHEFDEGVAELKRLQFGGCHPTDGCQDGDGFAGAAFPILAANVTNKITKLPSLLPLTIKFVGGVPVAFVGMTLEGTSQIVNPAGVTSVDFRDEVETANAYAEAVLEQQFQVAPTPRILQVSAGFRYTYNSTLPVGDRVSGIKLNNVDIDPAATYRVTTNDFLANGGDGFTQLTGGTNRTTAPGFDVDALVAYLAAGPVGPGPTNRITKVA